MEKSDSKNPAKSERAPSGRGAEKRSAPERPASARLCAARAVLHVLRDQEQLETALARQADYNLLESRDRAFARLIAATVFRRMGQIDAALKPFLTRIPAPLPHAVLRTGAAQLLFLQTPVHAAVGESVDILKRSSKTKAYSGLVNAVLRKVAAQGPALAASVPPSGNLPGWIRASWESAYGGPTARRMATQLMKTPPLDIHVRGEVDSWVEKLEGEKLSDWMVRLDSASGVTNLEGFEDGDWWVQDIAATLPVHCLGDVAGLSVLDMCAAPGGKTLQLASMGAAVTALDKSEERLERVKENLTRTKLEAEIIAEDALDWAKDTEQTYDVVMLDAPCSATGTFRRHPDVLHNRTPKDVGSLVRLQKRLLSAAAGRVKPGGALLFCTCSLQTEEGEKHIEPFLERHSDFELAEITVPNLVDPTVLALKNGYLRVLPHLLGESGGMDGFFIALFIKKK
ncbi:MAG: RsmB/NOP family class I SAM-dependent RNA methyltransferase [Alphaproteobacteria bacterium]